MSTPPPSTHHARRAATAESQGSAEVASKGRGLPGTPGFLSDRGSGLKAAGGTPHDAQEDDSTKYGGAGARHLHPDAGADGRISAPARLGSDTSRPMPRGKRVPRTSADRLDDSAKGETAKHGGARRAPRQKGIPAMASIETSGAAVHGSGVGLGAGRRVAAFAAAAREDHTPHPYTATTTGAGTGSGSTPRTLAIADRSSAEAWPLVLLGPGGDYARRYVAEGARIVRVPANAASRVTGATARRGLLAGLWTRLWSRFEALAIEIFSTSTADDDSVANDLDRVDRHADIAGSLATAPACAIPPSTIHSQPHREHSPHAISEVVQAFDAQAHSEAAPRAEADPRYAPAARRRRPCRRSPTRSGSAA